MLALSSQFCLGLKEGGQLCLLSPPPPAPLNSLPPDGWLSAEFFSFLKGLNVLISETGRGRTCRGLYRIITEKLMKELGIPSLEVSGGVGGGAGQEFRMKTP